jgi:hypothetical protein
MVIAAPDGQSAEAAQLVARTTEIATQSAQIQVSPAH